ncbi:MAG: ATP-binding protein [Rikenellaceae bacterium]
MATAFTSNLKRQRKLVGVVLILLWLLILSFIGLRYMAFSAGDGEGPSAEKLLYFDDLFLVIAVMITAMISVIGIIVSRLYNSLTDSLCRINEEHDSALQQEQEKIRIKRQLTNNISHELKTPICSILGYLEMIINNENLDDASRRTFIKKSYDQAERLRHLLSDLSTITRIDEASAMIERESVDLSSLIADVVDDTILQAQENHIKVINRVDDGVVIEGNQMLLYSTFRNLIDNAVAYSGGRRVVVELMDESDSLYTFRVEDNGIGVEERHLPYLFERFYRVDKGRSRKLGGTGLGLSIVKNAVIFHSGTIVAQTSVSGGLEFVFTLKKGGYFES